MSGYHVAYRPKPGYARNPIFQKVGRNEPCICGAGVKFKKCCMKKINYYIPEEDAEEIKKILEGGESAGV